MTIATIETHIISAMSLLHLASFLLVSETSEPIGLTLECCSSVATKRTRDMKNVEIHAVVVRFLSSSQEETLKSLQRLFLSLIHSATAPSYEIHLVASRLLSLIPFQTTVLVLLWRKRSKKRNRAQKVPALEPMCKPFARGSPLGPTPSGSETWSGKVETHPFILLRR